MLKKFLTILLIPFLLIATETVTYTYHYKDPVVSNGVPYLSGCRHARQGFAPMVSVQPVKLLLPDGYMAASYEVQYNDLVPVAGEHFIKPFRPAAKNGTKSYPGFHTRRSIDYETDADFPGYKRTEWFKNQLKNGHTIFFSSFSPMQYNPVRATVKIYRSVTVIVTIERSRESASKVTTPSIKSQLESLVDNKKAVSELSLTEQDENDYDYLIITMNDFKDKFNDFIEFNKRRCLKTQLQTVDYIKSNVTGGDDQEKIRNYIKDQYTNHKITYVLLGADESPSVPNDIPDRAFRARMYDNWHSPEKFYDERDLAADMYYECLDGDWKGSNDYYGDPGARDMTWEVYGGRWPVNNETHLRNIINKTIKYSEKPHEDVNNLMLTGHFLWNNYGVECWGGDNVEEHVGVCTNNGYTTHGFTPDEWDVERLYEKTAGIDWYSDHLIPIMMEKKSTVLIDDGHGSTTRAFGVDDYEVTPDFFKNNGDNANYFFIMTGACYPGNFDDGSFECLLELFIECETGAIGTVGNDKSGWGDDDGTDGCTHMPFRYIFDGLFNPEAQTHHLGHMVAYGKESCAEIVLNTTFDDPPYYGCVAYCVYGINLFGDPALSMWTKSPQTMQPVFTYENNIFKCDTKSPYSWVALCDKDGNIIANQLTGKDGKSQIDNSLLRKFMANNPAEDITVRIKAHNYLPYESGVTNLLKMNPKKSHTKTNLLSLEKTYVLNYILPDNGLVNISLYNSKGALIKTIVNTYQNSGKHKVNFSRNNLCNGIYYYRIIARNVKATEKFVVAR